MQASTPKPSGADERWAAIRELCREQQRSLTPEQRDQLLQLWIAQGMTCAQRAETTAMLCNAAIALHGRNQEDPAGNGNHAGSV